MTPISEYATYFVDSIVYVLIDAVAISIGIAIVLRLVVWFVPLKKWEAIRENGLALAIILSAALLVFGIISAATYLAPLPPPTP